MSKKDVISLSACSPFFISTNTCIHRDFFIVQKWRQTKIITFCDQFDIDYFDESKTKLNYSSKFKPDQLVLKPYPKWTSIQDLSILTARQVFNNNRQSLIELLSIIPNQLVPFEPSLTCSDNLNSTRRITTLRPLLDAHHFKYGVAYIYCPIEGNSTGIDSVLVENPLTNEQLKVTIHQPISENHSRPIVCVRPLFGPFTDSKSIIEFIAYYQANDIRDFVFFDQNVDESVIRLLTSLRNVTINIYKWNLTPYVLYNTLANGQMAAIRFCLDQFPKSTIIHVDLDEYVRVSTPGSQNLNQYLQLKTARNLKLSALIVRSTMFCEEHNRSSNKNRSDLKTLTNIKRQSTSWHWNKKSKVIYLRRSIVDVGIHYVWSIDSIEHHRFLPLEGKFWDYVEEVNDNELIINHYRECCNNLKQYMISLDILGRELDLVEYHPLEDTIIEDRSILKYANRMRSFIEFNVKLAQHTI